MVCALHWNTCAIRKGWSNGRFVCHRGLSSCSTRLRPPRQSSEMTGGPKTLNQRTAITLLKTHGWAQTAGGKHHVKMEKPGRRPITLPTNRRRDYPPGLRRAILREAGIE
jgi:predicted RNA binding protein YcfA (HicA-like mRNA interferase family)